MNEHEGWLFPADWQGAGKHSSPYSFMRLPLTRDLSRVDALIMGAGFDLATVGRPGARFGPRGIRNASSRERQYPTTADKLWGPFRTLRVADYGDLDLVPSYIDENLVRITAALAPVFAERVTPVVLGGDHAISLPVLRAAAATYGPLALVHFDSHPDFWPVPDPTRPLHHGTVFRLAAAEGLIDLERSVQVGIRGTTSMEIVEECRAAGFELITMDEIGEHGLDYVSSRIAERARGSVYLSLDIDVVDPAFAPGTGTPEVGGLLSRELIQLVRKLRGLDIVGYDLVEVAPPYDHAEITALLASALVYEFLEIRAARG